MQDLLSDYINRAKHWRSAHYEASMIYQRIEWVLGIPSVFLGAVILGFAFYSVERQDIPIWTQYTLAGLSILQGIIISIQAYLRPAALSEQHRATATRYSSIVHAYEKLCLELSCTKDVSIEQIEKIMSHSNDVAREAHPLPWGIAKRAKKSLNIP